MKKSDIKSMPEYFDRYINLTDDVTYLEALDISLKELENLSLNSYKALGDQVYAEGKWTVKDIFQHLIDTERVFSYRMTAFARGDKQQMLSFDEDLYARNSNANSRSLEDILDELILMRKNYIAQYKSYTPEMLQTSGKGFNGAFYSVLAMGFMVPGHQRWHLNILNERYLPLVKK